MTRKIEKPLPIVTHRIAAPNPLNVAIGETVLGFALHVLEISRQGGTFTFRRVDNEPMGLFTAMDIRDALNDLIDNYETATA